MKFKDHIQYENHKKKHKYSCTQCDEKLTSYKNLQDHLKIKHNFIRVQSKPIIFKPNKHLRLNKQKCDQCELEFLSECNF